LRTQVRLARRAFPAPRGYCTSFAPFLALQLSLGLDITLVRCLRPTPVDDSTAPATDKRIEIFLAEYQWVSSQIPFYRQVEVTALGASAIILSAVASVVAVLESGEGAPDRAAEGTLLAVSAWAPTLLLLVEIMALSRIRRAALYIRDHLRPRACSLTGDQDLLRWEVLKPDEIFFPNDEGPHWWWRFAVSSAPIVLAIGSVAIALAIAGAVIHPDSWTAPVLVSGFAAAFVGLCLAFYGVVLSWRHEGRHGGHPAD